MIKKINNIIPYFVTTYLITGIFYTCSILFNFPLYLFAPATVAIFIVGITKARGGTISFLKQIFLKKFSGGWLAIAIILPAIFNILIVFAYCKIENIPFEFHNNPTSTSNLYFIMVIVLGCLGEEIGWRGYLEPLMIERHASPLKASIILGFLWGIWHAGDYGEGIGFLLFVVYTMALSVMMTWLYFKANGNVLVAIVFHMSVNIVMNYIGMFPDGTVPSVKYRFISALVAVIFAVAIAVTSKVFKRDSD